MNNKCTKCGSANVVEGKLSTGTGGLVFTTQKSQKKLPLTQTIQHWLQKDVKNVELYLIFVWKTHKQLMKINKRELSVLRIE